MKIRFILYVVLAILFQVGLGIVTGQGQGGIAMLVFVIFVELDPHFSFTYLISTKRHQSKKED